MKSNSHDGFPVRAFPLSWIVLFISAGSMCTNLSFADEDRPNVILIMTDDQGYGDLGVTGNPVIETPNIDRLATQSASLKNFYVHPVCAPTRACLLTGRYNYRTRVVDTYVGRAMMEPDELTIAEILRDVGYDTGIFGKWHLGDCYPMRAMDQGFKQSIVHRGGGIGQPSDWIGFERKYTDPMLLRNGEPEQFQGYCTDVYYSQAIQFMQKANKDAKPFFVYLPDNCPHGPFHDVPTDWLEKYKKKHLSHKEFPQELGHPLPDKNNQDQMARIFAMISNVDQNVGRLLGEVERLGIADNTIVIFMVDNGPNSNRYVAGYRGMKTSVYEGGIRSPFFIRWPNRLEAGATTDRIAAHIDVLPTVLDACGVDPPKGLALDGKSVLGLLDGSMDKSRWQDRTIVIQSHRGNQPVKFHHFAIRNQRWKLLHHSGFGHPSFEGQPNFELYDMKNDPYEQTSVAAKNPKLVDSLKQQYIEWFQDVGSTREDNYAPPRIFVGTEHETNTTLTRQDWRLPEPGDGWGDFGNYWEITVAEQGRYALECAFRRKLPDKVVIRLGGKQVEFAHDKTRQFKVDELHIPVGDLRFSVRGSDGDDEFGPHQVQLKKVK